jgi:pSer/pThr/pTyr-binding forkhead associated (FHA) protein
MGVRLTIVAGPDGPLPEPLVFELDQERVTIGRGAGTDVRIPHLSVSESHASLRSERDGYVFVDQGSTNGTAVNGVRLPPGRKRKLVEGDRVELGAYVLTFQASLPIARATTSERTSELARRLFRQWQKTGAPRGPRLVVLQGANTGASLVLPEPPGRVVIGSAPGCQLVLSDPAVAAEHCTVARDLDGVLVQAVDPKRGFRVGDRELVELRPRDGQELRVGDTLLLFEEPADELLQALAVEPDARLAAAAATPRHPESPEADATGSASPSAPAHRVSEPSRPWDGDMLIYGLAALIIAASAAGLFVLLRD